MKKTVEYPFKGLLCVNRGQVSFNQNPFLHQFDQREPRGRIQCVISLEACLPPSTDHREKDIQTGTVSDGRNDQGHI